jgi:hypothetical protein
MVKVAYYTSKFVLLGFFEGLPPLAKFLPRKPPVKKEKPKVDKIREDANRVGLPGPT